MKDDVIKDSGEQRTADNTVTVMDNGVPVKILTVSKGTLLADLLADNGIAVAMDCGGKGLCKKCTVRLSDETSAEPCLACQTRINADITIYLAGNPPAASSFLEACPVPVAVSPFYSQWGLAVDIGTTTVHVSLIGAGVSVAAACINPQTALGADVISRIERAMDGSLAMLTEGIRETLRDIISGLAGAMNITPDSIDGAVITGNTTMLYLLTGKNPAPLATAPFEADCRFGETVPAACLGLGLASSAVIHIPRCVSAFAGADMITAILSSGMADNRKTTLLADIGTNGELALMHGGHLYCTSTAAGPAFEGYGLSCGTYGAAGAIDRVWAENGQIRYSTIAHAPATGICGSGIVDALAAMLDLGIMDETGYLPKPVIMTGKIGIAGADVRQIQLAKSAIRAGIETLIEIAGINKTQIEAFYIAGGFGHFLDLNHAARIGLIPAELLPVTSCLGNAAHQGAAMLLQDKALIKKTALIAECTQVIPLTSNPVFSDYFLKYMMF